MTSGRIKKTPARSRPHVPALFAALIMVFAFPGNPYSAGYAIKEQSALALGNAFAGATAGAEDITYMFFNPAGLTRHKGSQAAMSISYIMPTAKVQGASASTATNAAISGPAGLDDAGVDAAVPAMYLMWDPSERIEHDVRLGLGVNAPFGMETKYDISWPGRYHAVRSRLKTVNFNPAIAYKPLPQLSIAVGAQFQWIEAILTNSIDFGTAGALRGVGGAIPGQQDGYIRMRGDDWGAGWNAGILFEPRDDVRFGLSFRSKVIHKLRGRSVVTLDTAGIGQNLRNTTGAFKDTDVTSKAQTPETLSFGGQFDPLEDVTLMGEASWTRWSRFKELRIKAENPDQSDSITEELWRDSWFTSVGATYRPDDDLELRLGLAYDESPVSDGTRTPRLPGASRKWLAIGSTFIPFENARIDFSYTHIAMNEARIDLSSSGVGNTLRGNLDAVLDSHIDILSLQATLRF